MARRFIPALLVLWLIAAFVGWGWMAHFANTPGTQFAAPATLPAALRALLPAAGAIGDAQQLFVVLHPQCSCSRATLRELEQTLGEAPAAHPHLTLLLYEPGRLPPGWSSHSGLVADAEAFASLHPRLVRDVDGRYAASLHATTSGEVLLYSAQGRLLFQGGLTAARGHAGPSRGAALLHAALTGERTGAIAQDMTKVFGCSILAVAARAE